MKSYMDVEVWKFIGNFAGSILRSVICVTRGPPRRSTNSAHKSAALPIVPPRNSPKKTMTVISAIKLRE